MRRLLGAIFAVTLIIGPAAVALAADTSVGQKVDDAAVLSKVKAKLATERAKNLVSVNVDVKDGIVHLKGTVPTEADKMEAERLATSTEGVKQVMNELVVANKSSSTTSPSTTSPSASPSTAPSTK